MCDYSLMTFPNRLAHEGEDLAAHRFHCGSMGLVSVADLEDWRRTQSRSFWQILKTYFICATDPKPAVCIPPGTRVHLYSIPAAIRQKHDVAVEEEVVFTQLTAESDTFRDAVVFPNGATMLLQYLMEGQRLRVVRLETAEAVAERAGSLAAADARL